MKRFYQLVGAAVFGVASFLLADGPASGGELELSPVAKPAPFDLQGPFVSVGEDAILTVSQNCVWKSVDDGKTWASRQILDKDKYDDSNERALLRTKEGTILFAFLNLKERDWKEWGKGTEVLSRLPVYVARSEDDGETWSEPIKLPGNWSGAERSMIQLKSGRIVLVGQKIVPWENVTFTHVSDDQGKTWAVGDDLALGGVHDHDGAMEASVVELKDGSVYMLIRTTKGTFYESRSTDGGLTWSEPVSSGIQNNSCCCVLQRIADGGIVLIWNRNKNLPAYDFKPEGSTPTNWNWYGPNALYGSREELSIAFSYDECETWSEPYVVATRRNATGRDPFGTEQVSYPYLFERRPGEFWITTMFGGLRAVVKQEDVPR